MKKCETSGFILRMSNIFKDKLTNLSMITFNATTEKMK